MSAELGSLPLGAAAALVAAAWQGALLAVLVWVCLRMVPRLSAAVRSTVWLCVFVLLLGLQGMPILSGDGRSEAGAAPLVHVDSRWSVALAALWLAASLFRAAQLAYGALSLRQLLASAKAAPLSAELQAAMDEAAGGRSVRLCATEQIARPSVVGFFRPRVLMPTKLLENLSPAELKQVLIHEMEHLRRADDWTNLLQKLALVIFPLNPALAWVEQRLCAERELACDDRVLAAGGGRKAYALCLARLAEFSLLERGYSLVLSAWERRPELVRRVHRILRTPAQTMSRCAALGVSGGILATAACGALVLAHSPQLVSFAPLPAVAQASQLELREGMPAPTLVKASMTVARDGKLSDAVSHSGGKSNYAAKMRHSHVVVTALKNSESEPEVKLAALRLPPPPGGDKLMVMTDWNELDMQPQVILAEFREDYGKPVVTVPAVYIVATPNGWMIVQI